MQMNSWNDLAREFKSEIKGKWFAMYPDAEFIDRMIKATHGHYHRIGRVLPAREDWLRACESFMRKNWDEQKYRHGRPKSILETKTGYSQPQEHYVEKCPHCHDVYIVRAKFMRGSGEKLMICDCVDPLAKDLPALDRWVEHEDLAMTRGPLPTEWFRPPATLSDWLNRLKEAEHLWALEQRENEIVEF